MSDDIKHYIKSEGQDPYNSMLNSIQNSDEENKKSECKKYAETIVASNTSERILNMSKIGFALSLLLSCASVAGVCLSQNYANTGSRVGMSILSVLLLTTFVVTSIFSFLGMIDLSYCPNEKRVNGVAAELESAASHSLKTQERNLNS